MASGNKIAVSGLLNVSIELSDGWLAGKSSRASPSTNGTTIATTFFSLPHASPTSSNFAVIGKPISIDPQVPPADQQETKS
jgi:hypothetical protein